MDDIEDLITLPGRSTKYEKSDFVVPKVRKKKIERSEHEYIHKDSFIPGTHNVYVRTWGCSHNSSDGEYMAGQLSACGYHITAQPDLADLWLLNSCTVKNPAEEHFKNSVSQALKLGKKVVVAGCVPQAAPRSKFISGLSIVGVQQIDRVVEVVEETLKGNTVRLLGTKKVNDKKIGGASLELPKIRKNPLIEILAINTGCLNQCTYCKTKHARGDLASYPIPQLVERAKHSYQEGCCEIWLTSEDTGAYGRDIGVNLPQLLWELIEVTPEGCMIRIGMTNPPYILEHLEEMSKILNHPRVYSFLHIPVQSGSDSVLMDMKREYCADDFRQVVNYLKARVPNLTIATDIICGFPTETLEDFADTVSLVKEFKFPSLFINQFFPRPGTPAARLRRINTQEVKQRTRELTEVFQSYHPYTHKMGDVFNVLVTELSHDKQHYVAHNKCYDQILVPMVQEYIGKMVKVKVVETGKHYMKGQVLSHTPFIPKINVLKMLTESMESRGTVFKFLFTSFWIAVVARLISIFILQY